MAVKCAAKSLLERKQWLQRGSGSGILLKAQRTTSIQRVISSNCSAIEPSHLKNAASVSGRWMRLDGLKEGDFIPLAKGRGRSQLGFESEPARIDDGAGSD